MRPGVEWSNYPGMMQKGRRGVLFFRLTETSTFRCDGNYAQ